MTASLIRPAHWDDPDPVPGFHLQHRRVDVGIGEVWQALGPDARSVLVRCVDLADDELSRAKAGRLAGLLPLLEHPDLDPVRQVVPSIGGLALIRSAAAGDTTSLATLLTRRRSLSAAEVVGVADRLGRALGYLHDNGVTHGRLTAGDVLLQPTGRPVLTGFGVAGIQGAGGFPRDDVAALSGLLLPMLAAGGGPDSETLRAALMGLAETGVDGHALADEVLRCCDPAPIRMRPSPGSRSIRVRHSRPPSFIGSESAASPAPVAGLVGGSGSPVSTATKRPPPAQVDTLDAAVRALRAGARQSGARRAGARRSVPRHRSYRSPRVGKPAARRPRQPPVAHSRGKTQPPRWPWRIAPAAAILLATVVVGWRFLGPSATADARSRPAMASTASPDRTTIARLDAFRSAAFAAGAISALSAADAPDSPALATDTQAMSIMLGHRGRAHGLAPRLFTVTLLSRAADRALVRVVDELPPYDFVTPAGQIIARSPGHARQAHDVALRLVSGQWRYEAVAKAAEPAPSAGGAP